MRKDWARYRPDDVQPVPDALLEGCQRWFFPDGFLQDGAPMVLRIQDPPGTVRPAHWHGSDLVYFFVQGEQVIEPEGTYRAGDVRWVRAGHWYGPETAGPEGATWWVVSFGDPTPCFDPPSVDDPESLPGKEPRQ